MPLVGTARLYRGMSPGPDPARAPLTRRLSWRGSLVGGSRRGSALPAKVRQAERRCTRERGMRLVHVWSTCHRSRAVLSGLQRYIVAEVAGAILGKRAYGQNPDKDEFDYVLYRPVSLCPWPRSGAQTLSTRCSEGFLCVSSSRLMLRPRTTVPGRPLLPEAEGAATRPRRRTHRSGPAPRPFLGSRGCFG
jgi:hypothetical protein